MPSPPRSRTFNVLGVLLLTIVPLLTWNFVSVFRSTGSDLEVTNTLPTNENQVYEEMGANLRNLQGEFQKFVGQQEVRFSKLEEKIPSNEKADELQRFVERQESRFSKLEETIQSKDKAEEELRKLIREELLKLQVKPPTSLHPSTTNNSVSVSTTPKNNKSTAEKSVSDSSTSPRNITSWCVLDRSSTKKGKFAHFPHALQTLALCWSYFMTQPASHKRGLWFTPGVGGGFGSIYSDWRSAVAFQVMGCELEYSKNATPDAEPWYRPETNQVDNRRYFFKPEDAEVLREGLYSVMPKAAVNRTWSGLHIGIVDRKGSRKILNLDEIESAIRKEYPLATIERTCMEDVKPPINQFQWWARQDIVLLGHGAGVANMVFLNRNASVIEIFPPHYYNLGFWCLGRATGVRNYGYFNGVDDPVADYKKYGNGFEKRISLRSVDLEPPVDVILNLVKQAISETGSGNYTPQVDARRQFPASW